jgi:hypothetical protein
VPAGGAHIKGSYAKTLLKGVEDALLSRNADRIENRAKMLVKVGFRALGSTLLSLAAEIRVKG